MVKIAVAGGSGQVAREVIDDLILANKHDITILSRDQSVATNVPPEIKWRVVDYNDQEDLAEALRGVHTLLSFLQLLQDPESKTQKKLINAAVLAGVKRFAPSEYGSAGTTHMPWWAGKESAREYLKHINRNGKVLEYTLFQPGLFLDYLAFPYKTSKHIDPLQSVFDFQNCRALMVEGHEDAIMTLTSANDMSAVIAKAVDYDGEWPEVGGIRGNFLTYSQVIEIGERIRGRPFSVDKVTREDLENGVLNTSWALEKKHKAVIEDGSTDFVKLVSIGILLSSVRGAWESSAEMNKLFPEYKFETAEEFLGRAWNAKP